MRLDSPDDGGEKLTRLRVEVKGIVQGVGFRPFVFGLAQRYGLKGRVFNSVRGVEMDLEGPGGMPDRLLREINERPPRLARITQIDVREIPPRGYTAFEILESSPGGERDVLISPDVAVCPDCKREVDDPSDRRHRYPFTNCTNCGPRFTIISGFPYDRERTTMSVFPMCPRCRREYRDPGDRRFHAQPIACPECGPRAFLADRMGRELSGSWPDNFRRIMLEGNIVAVKGLGGFHLACDARNEKAVEELRRRKGRPAKPFAVMCRDLEAVRKYCRADEEECRWLNSPEAPIVILERRGRCPLPGILAPNVGTLGVMLPYTPLHMLLFDDELDVMVMTSGNAGGLPLVRENSAAMDQLGRIADCFLLHDREIYHGCDDSLLRVIEGQPHIYRRSRGFVPGPVNVPPGRSTMAALGLGGEMKNTFCLLKGDRAILSQHLGDMYFREGMDYFRVNLESLQKLFGIMPEIIAHDMHPGYAINSLAGLLPAANRVAVQHHHAHMAACMAENGLDRKVIGVVCDGTGYGADGCIWGFEILAGDYVDFERKYHLAYLPVPGGDSAIRNTWRMGVAYLSHYLGGDGLDLALGLFPGREREVALTARMAAQGFNSPPASSCGRLFDAVSAMLGACLESTYEGQAAVELSHLVVPGLKDRFPYLVSGGIIDPGPMIEGIAGQIKKGVDPAVTATMFHNTVIAMIVEAVTRAGLETGIDEVVLSGGSFQNQYLFLGVKHGLAEKGRRVYFHREVPANDGGISLGQAVVASRRLRG